MGKIIVSKGRYIVPSSRTIYKTIFKTPIGIRVEFLSDSRLFFDHRKEYIRSHPVPLTGAVNAFLIERQLREFYGSYVVALTGRICPAESTKTQATTTD